MSPKAIFVHAELEFWIKVAANLRDNYGWEFCYFIGSGKYKEKALKFFPNAVYHTNAEAIKNFVPDECKTIPRSPLDEKLLSALSYHESIFMKMMDRYNVNESLSYQKRIYTYHSQLMYWKGMLEHFKPDIVVFRLAPHSGFDYSLYALCRIINIPTVMFERASIPGFIYPVRSFEEGSEDIKIAYAEALERENKQQASLSPETRSHLDNLSKSYDQAMPFHLNYKLKHFKRKGDIGGRISILLRLATTFLYWLILKKGDFDYLFTRYHKKMGLFKRKKLRSHYNRLANEVNLDEPNKSSAY